MNAYTKKTEKQRWFESFVVLVGKKVSNVEREGIWEGATREPPAGE